MKIKLYRSATVGIHFKDFKILMDPWLTDGEYYGSWSHYPYYDLTSNIDEINSYNAIYISHIHPDHCSENTLKMINKNIPIYIHSYHTKFLKFKLERLGFKVNELIHGKKYSLSKYSNINIYAADNCNPELCLKIMGCADLTSKNGSQQIDTLAVFDDGKNVLVNTNDCPFELAKSTLDQILKDYSDITGVLTGYSGAGHYPQCFKSISNKDKIVAAKLKQQKFLNQAIKFIEKLKAKTYLPFAGTYTLTGKLSKLQDLRGVPLIDDAFLFFENYFKNSKNYNHVMPMKISADQTFDLDLKENSSEYKFINKLDYKNYIDENLKHKKLDYENDIKPNFDELYELSKSAFTRFLEKKEINNVKLDTDIYLKVNEKLIKLNKNNTIDKINEENFTNKEKYLIYETDPRLLKKLLMGPKYAHWNNAEIGSHINFYRNFDNYDISLYESLIYLHN